MRTCKLCGREVCRTPKLVHVDTFESHCGARKDEGR